MPLRRGPTFLHYWTEPVDSKNMAHIGRPATPPCGLRNSFSDHGCSSKKGAVLPLLEYSLFFVSLLGYAKTFRQLTKVNFFAVRIIAFSTIICTE